MNSHVEFAGNNVFKKESRDEQSTFDCQKPGLSRLRNQIRMFTKNAINSNVCKLFVCLQNKVKLFNRENGKNTTS